MTDHADQSTAGICDLCGGPHRFDTSVPSVLWNAVVRARNLPDYLCTTCVVEAFARAGVSFMAELYGDGFSGVPLSVEINGVVGKAAQLIQDQNNVLRSALSRIAHMADEAHSAACRDNS